MRLSDPRLDDEVYLPYSLFDRYPPGAFRRGAIALFLILSWLPVTYLVGIPFQNIFKTHPDTMWFMLLIPLALIIIGRKWMRSKKYPDLIELRFDEGLKNFSWGGNSELIAFRNGEATYLRTEENKVFFEVQGMTLWFPETGFFLNSSLTGPYLSGLSYFAWYNAKHRSRYYFRLGFDNGLLAIWRRRGETLPELLCSVKTESEKI